MRRKGQSLVEAVVGAIIIIPIVLLALDAYFVISANRSNQELTQNTARMAANKPTEELAREAVEKSISKYETSSIIRTVELTEFKYDVAKKFVTVSIAMNIELPVPLPGASSIRVVAHWVEPIVAIPAPS